MLLRVAFDAGARQACAVQAGMLDVRDRFWRATHSISSLARQIPRGRTSKLGQSAHSLLTSSLYAGLTAAYCTEEKAWD